MILENSFQMLYGLVGHPLGHSFSASYFSEKFAREGINAVYRNFDIEDPAEVRDLFYRFPNLRGLNVTIPHKQTIIPYLDGLQVDAHSVGAVNVIKPERSGDRLLLHGFNSDYIGFRRTLNSRNLAHKAALILGTGGASCAIRYALSVMRIKTLFVSRTSGEGRITYADIDREIMAKHTLIVNTTPLGMFPKVDDCPAIPYELLTPDHLLYDLVYNPEETLFMKRGKQFGATVMNGLEMLHKQADAAWNIWQGKFLPF